MELLILLGLIVLNGVFALSEIAVVSSRRARLEQMISEEKPGADVALELSEDPNRFLSTIQIGITLIGIVAGAFGGANLTGPLADTLDNVGIPSQVAAPLSSVLVVALTTYLSLVIGELVPKRLALQHPERYSSLLARPMNLLSAISAPVVWFLSQSTSLVVRLLGVRESEGPPVTDMEILSMMREGASFGVFEFQEQRMVAGVLRLDKLRVGALITPRTEIAYLRADATAEAIREIVTSRRHSVYPVVSDGMDTVQGIVRAKDILAHLYAKGADVSLPQLMRRPLYVPATLEASEVLKRFKTSGIHTALVVDEYGGIAGLVTMHDVMEEIVGELDGEFSDDEQEIVRRDDGSFWLDGVVPIHEVADLFPGVQLVPDDERNQYDTIAGFVMHRLERIPATGDHFDWAGLRFEVVDMDGVRVDKVLVAPLKSHEHESTEKE